MEPMKKYLTIGVAGHVDHGKTALVRYLTGIDTDRNPEEKRRGLSIEPGVAAWSPYPEAGIALIDVPGHVDFLKNAIRGLNSVDLALLVVAADDGVMPQTREHLDILRYFGARGGLTVLSKTDLVDHETIAIAKLELQEILDGTFLQGRPIVEFSTKRPSAASLIQALQDVIDETPVSTGEAPFRLWIDQVRQLTGTGTVVSGTVLSGVVREGDDLELLPAAVSVRARSLECHGHRVSKAFRGQRVGINLPKIPLSTTAKGMVLADPETLPGSRMFNAAMHMRPGSAPALKNGQKVKLFIGTATVQATVVLMGPARLEPGQRGLVQLRLAQRLHAAARDAFVIAPLNRNQVLGGGLLLEPSPQKYRPAKHTAIVPFLEALSSRDVSACVDLLLEKNAHRLMTARDLCAVTGLALGPLEAELNARVNRGELVYFKGRGAVKRSHYDRFREDALACVALAMETDPFRKGLAAGEIRDDLAPAMDAALLGALLNDLMQSGRLEENGGRFRLPAAAASLDARRSRLLEEVSAIVAASDICPFSAAAVRKGCQFDVEKAEVRQILNYLIRNGHLIRLKNGRYLTPAALETIKERVRGAITARGRLKLSDSIALLGYGRMGAVPVFDYLDQIGFTVRRGNERILQETARHEPAIP